MPPSVGLRLGGNSWLFGTVRVPSPAKQAATALFCLVQQNRIWRARVCAWLQALFYDLEKSIICQYSVAGMVFWAPVFFSHPFPSCQLESCQPPCTIEVGVPIRRLKILAKFALETRAKKSPDDHPFPRETEECSWGFARVFRAAPLSLTSRTYYGQRREARFLEFEWRMAAGTSRTT